MSTNAIAAKDTKVAVTIVATPTDIPEIESFSGPGGQAEVKDVSDLNSTAVEKRMGLPDSGTLGMKIWYIPDNTVHAYLYAAWQNSTLEAFRITYTDTGATTHSFSAYVTGFSISTATNGTVEADVTLEIDGAITEA